MLVLANEPRVGLDWSRYVYHTAPGLRPKKARPGASSAREGPALGVGESGEARLLNFAPRSFGGEFHDGYRIGSCRLERATRGRPPGGRLFRGGSSRRFRA